LADTDDHDISYIYDDWQFYPVIALLPTNELLLSFLECIDWDDHCMKALKYPAVNFRKTSLQENYSFVHSNQSPYGSSPAIAVDDSGGYAIAWAMSPGINLQLQRYSNDGSRIGEPIPIIDQEGIYPDINFPPAICYAKNKYIAIWTPDNSFKLYGRILKKDGTYLTDNFLLSDNRNWNSPTQISCDSTGNFVVTWTWLGRGIGRLFNSEGLPMGAEFFIADTTESEFQGYLDVSMNQSGEFVIVWEDHRNGHWDIFGQRYQPDGSKLGPNFRVHQNVNVNHFWPRVKLKNDRIYTTWYASYPLEKGYNIWANILDFNDPSTTILEDNTFNPKSFTLHQNFPNPFNPNTTIEYELAKPSQVELTIFNNLGQKVKTLIQKQQSAGSHKLTWDGKNQAGQPVPSGIYFYRLKTEEGIMASKKMVLLK